jgi:hypothetical protein
MPASEEGNSIAAFVLALSILEQFLCGTEVTVVL